MATSLTQTGELLWFQEQDIPEFKPLHKNLTADVCIVGAGIAGMTTAYLLAKEGWQVVVLEAKTLGNSETGRTSAHLSNALDDRYARLERLFGEDGARLAAESHTAAIDRIEHIARDEEIDCEFERLDGYLFLSPGDSRRLLEEELAAAQRSGLHRVRMVDSAPLPFDNGPALLFPHQGQFHPLKYLSGLVRAATERGVRIFTESPVEKASGGTKTKAFAKTRDGFQVNAEALVVATNTPFIDVVTMHTKQAPYRTYVMVYRVPKGSITKALYWDTQDDYHYIRLEAHTDKEDYLVIGGEDHKTGQGHPEDAFARLDDWARERFSNLHATDIHWSGQVLEPVDALAFIGRNPGNHDNEYIATGDSGHGMTHGTIAGMLLTDLICGRSNPWEKLYDPARTKFASAVDFLGENLNVAAQYIGWLWPGRFQSAEDIKPGEGVILQRGLGKIAACRDDDGKLHEVSAVCPHLGCIVGWNSAEKTWDCPCHGSRFQPDGKVVNGPAASDLPKVN